MDDCYRPKFNGSLFLLITIGKYNTMNNVEKLLLKALNDISDAVVYSGGTAFIKQVIEKVNVDYLALTALRKEPVQWNTSEPPLDARDCKDHPAVRNTDYMEVHHLTGTSGCSPKQPYWTWPVLGVIERDSGKQLVVPGDWILEPTEGVYVVIHNEQYEALYGSADVLPLCRNDLAMAAYGLQLKAGMNEVEYWPKWRETCAKHGYPEDGNLTDLQMEVVISSMFGVNRSGIRKAAAEDLKRRNGS
jgi:hypothetical protein